jgi:hypothetical protein
MFTRNLVNFGQNPVVFLDADEVLFDFIGGAARVHGIESETLQAYRTPSQWDISRPLGELVLGRSFSQEEFWLPINHGGSEFWEKLSLLPWWEKLIQLVETYTTEWHIVSAPSRCPTSYTGKVKAFKKVFGQDFDRFILTPHKSLFAKPATILIDDREQNVTDFCDHGGSGLLFASMGNSLHAFADDPIRHLSDSLQSLLEN